MTQNNNQQKIPEERRITERPTLIQAGIFDRLNDLTLSATKIFDHGWKGVAVMAVITITSLTAMALSINFRLALIDEKSRKISGIGVLEREVKTLESNWSSGTLIKAQTDSSAINEKIFRNYEEVAFWLQQETIHAKAQGLSLKYTLGNSKILVQEDPVISLPIKFKFELINRESQNGYAVLLKNLQAINATTWQHQLLNVGMESAGIGVNKLQTTLSFLMQAPENFDDGIGSKPEEQISPGVDSGLL